MISLINCATCLICLILLATVQCDPAPFTVCDERPVNSADVKVDVSDCGSTVRCNLLRGSVANFTIHFTPTISSKSNLERYILAKFPNQKDTGYEVPYGGAEEVQNTTRVISTMNFINGIESNVPLIHNSLFPVMKGAPTASLTVRYIIREKVENVPRKQKHWKLHPGNLFICILIPVQLV